MAAEIRPNIRIEIHNNLAEAMEVDEDENLAVEDNEDGEIVDTNETEGDVSEHVPIDWDNPSNRAWPSSNGGFTTGVDIFDKKEQGKLQERAKRFGLRPTEITNFTDEQMQELHESLGITGDEEKEIRFEAIHMRGTDNMSTEDIFEYFGRYGPAYIEWINDETCNVVWADRISAARALHFTSKPIKGMPVEGPCDPFVKELGLNIEAEDKGSELDNTNSGCSILLKNPAREVQLQKEDEDMTDVNENKENTEGFFNISDITVPIPPGYWRGGIEHPKAKCILLRFAIKTDKKPLRAERFSDYYRKYGNPNYGGLKGLISESRRMKFKGIFDRNKDIGSAQVEDKKNPWGQLAENWHDDASFAEKDPVAFPVVARREVQIAGKSDLMNRLGFKRAHKSEEKEIAPVEIAPKKSKVPRMRMYADEEEEKVKRKKKLQEVKLHHNNKQDNSKGPDLRDILGVSNKRALQSNEDQLQNIDLASTLKSRDLSDKLINRIRPDLVITRSISNIQVETVNYIPEREKTHNPVLSNTKSLRTDFIKPKSSRIDDRSQKHKKESLKRPHYDRSRYEDKLHSDRYERPSRNTYMDEEDVVGRHRKTQSKVAVVIKTQKKPAVASTIWSRINIKKERLKTTSEKFQQRDSSTSSESSSSESSSSSSSQSSSDDSSESEAEPPITLTRNSKAIDRPGFRSDLIPATKIKSNRKSPLRIEISNDHFKRKE